MYQNESVFEWLLGNDNQAVKYRTLTDVLDKPCTDSSVIDAKSDLLVTLPQIVDKSWMLNVKGLWRIYNLVALAECGLNKSEIDASMALNDYFNSTVFDAGCGDALILRALVSLGYTDDERVLSRLNSFGNCILPDGGSLCMHRLNKLKYIPKSCIRNNMHVLLMLAECKRKGLEFKFTDKILEYFMRRGIFYRSDSIDRLVLNCHKGCRMIDNFFPCEVMHMGLPQLLYAFSVLGAGDAPELEEAWKLLESKKNMDGKYLLEGTPVNSYLKKEKVGKPSKWVTLYALLAKKSVNSNK